MANEEYPPKNDTVSDKGNHSNEVHPPPIDETSPLIDFFKQDSIAALFLVVAAVAALAISNSEFGYAYHVILESQFGVMLGEWDLSQTIHHWINDGLMAVFFFMVGLEIKREVLTGELATLRKAILPAAGAVGGMILPALIYLAFNFGTPAQSGWGIPMATDIAFAMGCIALLGTRVPPALAVFLVALAIVDDLGAVAVIALFYSESIDLFPLFVGGGLISFSFLMGILGVRATLPYALIFVLVWFAFLQSGVHATVAGVLLAFTIPADARYSSKFFSGRMRELVDRFDRDEMYEDKLYVNASQQHLIRKMTAECHHVEAPLQRIEHNLHPISVFIIMPLFAFANAGVELPMGTIGDLVLEPVTLGVALGLLVGKPLGITLAAYIACKVGLAQLPSGTNWRMLAGVSFLAAIGFTMSLFINELAFYNVGQGTVQAASAAGPVSEQAQLFITEGKLGIMMASFLAGVIGLVYLRAVCPEPDPSAPRPGHH